MNTPFAGRKNLLCVALSCAAILLTVAPDPARGQTANATTATTDDTNDVSHFPSLDRLPGKVPKTVWTGLAGTWSRDHVKWQATITNDVGAVVFLGDSITEGWTTLAKDFPNLRVANRGIGGDITSGVLYRLKADVLSLNPAAIVLLIGTNDVGDGADPDDIVANIRLILLAIKNFNPKVKVIVCEIMPRSDSNYQVYDPKIQKANELLAAYVQTEPNFALCDTWSVFADAQGNQIPEDFRTDRLHLNPTGYSVWKKALDPVMAKMQFGATAAQ